MKAFFIGCIGFRKESIPQETNLSVSSEVRYTVEEYMNTNLFCIIKMSFQDQVNEAKNASTGFYDSCLSSFLTFTEIALLRGKPNSRSVVQGRFDISFICEG